MNEVVIAVFESSVAAERAVDDLNAARIPSALARQFVDDPAAPEGLLELRGHCGTSGDRIVAVTVEERHASVVRDILGMQGPASLAQAQMKAAA